MMAIPIFSDDALKRLRMPVMTIVGGKDVMLDSAETKLRLESTLAHAEICFLPEAGHIIAGQTAAILDFLLRTGERHG
jgi:pimeloyl-ACP methyl ester carboxylesterase